MGWSKVKTILAFIGGITVLYLCGNWALGIINDLLLWFQSTGIAQ